MVKFLKNLWKAFRPFSLTLAIGSTTFSIASAYKLGDLNIKSPHDILLIFLITITRLLAQSGANLVDDYFEWSFRYYRLSWKN